MIIRTPLNTLLGYGNCGANIAYNLSKLDPNLYLSVIGNNPYFTNDKFKVILQCRDLNQFNKNDTCVTVWHEHQLIENHIGRGKYIGLPFFEINKLDPFRLAHLNYPDIIISSSTWMYYVLKNHGIDSVIIHMGVDTSIFKPTFLPEFNSKSQEKRINAQIGNSCRNEENDKYKFFNIGKIEIRKGHDLLHKAFKVAFPTEKDVELNIFWESPVISPQEVIAWTTEYKDILGDRVVFHKNTPTDLEFAAKINMLDCGVFPTRSEGFGMPILQSMACNKPVITTNYSAIADFCNENTSHIVNIDSFEPAYDGKYFHGQGTWATINFDELVERLRYCYRHRIISNKAGLEMAKSMTWENTCNEIWKLNE